MTNIGKFIISLDFELHWGRAEQPITDEMKRYFMEARKSIPEVLNVFETNHIRATWATVGFLFAKNKEQLLLFSPSKKPTYENQRLSYYGYFDQLGPDEEDDPFHFGHSLIEKIVKTEGQELGTHTFAHYYCNEAGQRPEQFEADLVAAQAIAKENFDIVLKSLVFPRNQYNQSYLTIAKQHGIEIVRSNPDIWFWNKQYGKLTPFIRATDTLFRISGELSFNSANLKKGDLIELPASRFFRPYIDNERLIQGLKIKRIKKEMLYAAQRGINYHLWWHPHNFGENVCENIKQLKTIVEYYTFLNKTYGFQSAAMVDFV